VMLNRFRGNLDSWDPLLVDTIAAEREVILVDNAGVGLSTGTVPREVAQMARDAIAFLDAAGLSEIDLLGYSIGGMVAQDVALLRPQQVRRLILAATGPRGGGTLMHGWITDIARLATAPGNGPDDVVRLFFAPTETSVRAGHGYLARFLSRTTDRDADLAPEGWAAQYDAVVEWGIPEPSKLARLAGIRQPTLVANGDNDTMIPTGNSHVLGDRLPNARVRIFPDAGHGFLYQWAAEFGDLIKEFLR
jgi:pimeloyl-ACP methyl ester carboxylesterase